MSERVQRLLKEFFPAVEMSLEEIEAALADGHIITEKGEILRYVQAALLDDKVLEVKYDGLPGKYFTRLKDWTPPEGGEESGEIVEDAGQEGAPSQGDSSTSGGAEQEQEGYKEGDYLLTMTHIFAFPVEPPIGNMLLRDSKAISIRMSISASYVEFGTTYLQQETVGGAVAHKLAFPPVVRIVKTDKVYRAKVVESMPFTVVLEMEKEELSAEPVNISVKGITIAVEKEQLGLFAEGDTVKLHFSIEGEDLAPVSCFFRQSMRIRNSQGVQHLCELEFHLRSLAETGIVESTVAKVQRVHLKELAEKSDAFGVNIVM